MTPVLTHAVKKSPPLITSVVDYGVELRELRAKGGLAVPENKATVRVDKNNETVVLAVVGDRYEVVDHRDVIKSFAKVLEDAKLVASVKHDVFRNGARVYSRFMLDEPVVIKLDNGLEKQAFPFFTLTNSHDGALKVGFMLGAVIDGQSYQLSRKLYEVTAKHLQGVKLQKVLAELANALRSFTNEVVPLWRSMMTTPLTLTQGEEIIAKAVKKNVISQQRAEQVPLGSHATLWELYTDVVKTVSEPSKKGTAEEGIWRNAGANEYFIEELRRLVTTK
jgi:transcriptional antiterminator Rof (Rho-off)